MKLEELTGSHILKGIETGQITIEDLWRESNCNYIKFTLDETTYMAIENPADGYRSYMEELQTTEEPCRIKVPDIQVVCHMREDEYEACDVLEFIDAMNGKKILAVGTANVADYYPHCVMEYTPENMYCNEERGWIVQKCIEKVNKQPSADVVPKSEVESMSHKCENCAGCTQWVCECSLIEEHAKTEGASEIFAEIEKIINRYCKDYKYSIADVLLDIAEAKKKYIGGEDAKTNNID